MSLSFEPEMGREGTGGVFQKTVEPRPSSFDFAMKRACPPRKPSSPDESSPMQRLRS
jgi:hypothetical protein